MDLHHVRALLIDETRSTMLSLAAPAPVARQAVALRDLGRLFEGVGICQLLLEADVMRFRENLVRAAQARRYFLLRAHREGDTTCRFLGLSRSDAVWQAIVVGQPALVAELVGLHTPSWHADWDYEDDFAYRLFVHGVATQPGYGRTPEAQALLARFERALDGQRDPRLTLCKAWVAQEGEAFADALRGMLMARQMKLDEVREGITEYSAQALFWPQSFVSIEALAWLRLADAQGLMPAQDDFLYCPALARQPGSPGLQVADFFQSLDVALQA